MSYIYIDDVYLQGSQEWYTISMDTQFQDIEWVTTRATKDFKQNKNRRISSLFRDLRKNPHFSLLGDYGILWAIAKAMDSVGVKRKRDQFITALQYSSEYKGSTRKEKRIWLDNLTGVLE